MARRESDPRGAAIEVIRVLRGAGHVAYLAGGCVRDELLGLSPKDYDVATDATPAQVVALFPRTREVGAAFGVVLVQGRGAVTEVATFRKDGPYSDKRRPDGVEFSSAEEDAKRRDFTVNALFLDPEAGDRGSGIGDPGEVSGRVIDFVGGMEDLRAGVIRAVGDPGARLAEDHLRALRAARFAARFGFAIEPVTAGAIRAQASALAGVSRERVGDEVRRMMLHPTRAAAAAWLADLGLDVAMGVRPSGTGLGAGAGGNGALRGLGGVALPVWTALAAWAVDLGWPVGSAATRAALVPRWRGALCLSNEERDGLAGVLRDVELLLSRWMGLPVAQAKRAAASATFGEARRLAGVLDPGLSEGVAARLGTLAAIGGGLWPERLLDGDRLVEIGIRPGRRFGRVLEAVFDAQLEGRVADRAGAEALARELAAGGGVE